MTDQIVDRKLKLQRLLKLLVVIGCLAVIYISAQFISGFDEEKPQSSASYDLSKLVIDSPSFFIFDNFRVLVVKRSKNLQTDLYQNKNDYWDIDSEKSTQPSYAKNRLRSKVPEIFVAIAIGTDFVCPIKVLDSVTLIESCNSKAQYDFAGRALKVSGGNNFKNLHVPQYKFDEKFSTLTVFF